MYHGCMTEFLRPDNSFDTCS